MRRLPVAVDDDPPRLSRRRHRAHRQLRVVLQHGADAGQDRAGARAPRVAVGARLGAGDPLALAVDQRGAAVEAGGELDAHPRTAAASRDDEPDVELARSSSSSPSSTAMPAARSRCAPPAAAGIGIAHRGDHARDAGRRSRHRRRARAAVVVAGLERHVQRGAARIVPRRARIGQRVRPRRARRPRARESPRRSRRRRGR